MHIAERRCGTVSALLLSLALSACAGSSEIPPASSTSGPPITAARYFFSASGLKGVLEVSLSPPSICYSTQSYPARPIEIQALPVEGIAHVEESYAPHNNNFCDRTVRPALAADLLVNPSGYLVRWRPRAGGPLAFSSFTTQ